MVYKRYANTGGTLPCLSVRDPWARAILYLEKDVENRTWDRRYTGELLIHVGMKQEDEPDLEDRLSKLKYPMACLSSPGHIIGVVHLDYITQNYRSKWAERGQYHWVLSNPRPFVKPVPYRGMLGLFNVPVRLLPELKQLV